VEHQGARRRDAAPVAGQGDQAGGATRFARHAGDDDAVMLLDRHGNLDRCPESTSGTIDPEIDDVAGGALDLSSDPLALGFVERARQRDRAAHGVASFPSRPRFTIICQSSLAPGFVRVVVRASHKLPSKVTAAPRSYGSKADGCQVPL